MRELNTFKFAFAVARNELLQLRRSRTRLLLSLVILPLFFTSTLGGTSGGEGSRFSATAHVPIAFVDEDLSPASGQLYQTLASSGDFYRLVQGYRVENAIPTLGTGKLFAALVVPKGFQKDLEDGRPSRVILYVDDGSLGLGDSIASNLRIAMISFNPNQNDRQATEAESFSIQIIERSRSFSGFAIGLTVVIAMVQIFATFYEISGGISREREDGTYARLLLSPAGVGSMILGKTLYDLLLNFIRMITVIGIALYGFGASLNVDLGSIIVVSLLIALVTMGVGFLVSSLKVGIRTVVIIEFLLILSLFSFSGLIIDRELMRGYAKTISFLLPWSYGFDALRGISLMGRSLLDLSYDIQVMTFSAGIFYALSYLLLNRSRERLAT